MDWFVVLILGILVLACMDDVHTKWHKRQMARDKHWKETVYT